jgi:hypothetical protein
MSHTPDSHAPWWPVSLSLLAGLLLAAVFGHVLMRMPIDYGDNFTEVANTYGAPLGENLAHEFAHPGFYFRPLEIVWRYVIAFGFREGVFGYNRFMAIESALLVTAFALVCRPRNGRDVAAFLVALAVLVGHHGTQAIWEFGTTFTYGLMVFVGIITIGLVGRSATRSGQVCAVFLTAFCLLAKELGLVVAGVFVLAYVLRMPGVRRSTAAIIVLIAIAYLGFHFNTLPDLSLGGQTRAKGVVEYLSNMVATLVMFWIGIPFDGAWTASARFLGQPWQWAQIAVGPPTLLLLAGAWRLAPGVTERGTDHAPVLDRRWFILFAAALLASCALGFYITRHRLGAPAVPLLAYCTYLSMRVLLWRLDGLHGTSANRPSFLLTATTVAGLACAGLWPVRVVTGFEYVRALSGRIHGDFPKDIPARWNALQDFRRPFLVPFVESIDMMPWARRHVPVLEALGKDVVYSVNR